MFKNVFRKCRQNRGFTLMEVMVVVAILAVVVLIAVPSVIKMRQNMKFAERNDYAKSIYMAAQSNLTQMRSMGELGLLEQAAKDDDATKGIPSDVNSADFYCSSSEGSSASYNLIVPSSIDSTIRNQKVIVEYNPIIGVVYSVFYYEGNDSLKSKYESGIERDNEAFLKESQIGYYSVDKIDVLNADDAFKIYQLESTITFDNTQQGIITVDVPAQYTAEGTPKNLLADDPECTRYMQSMEVKLSISGENGGAFTTTIKAKDEPGFTEKCYVIQAAGAVKTIRIKVPIDSLTDGSFSQIADNKKDSDNFNSPPAIAPGDNVTITANVTFHPSAKDDIIMIESATIAGINPMYHSLTPNPNFDTAPNAQNTEKPYILAISNGRHLQNLSYLDADFAQNIESIVFTQQAEDPVQPDNGSTSESQPANGAKTSTNTGSQENNTPAELKLDWAKTVEAYSSTLTFQPIEFEDFTYVPSILGNGVEIQNLTVSSAVDGNAGLFAALKNTSVEKITLKNPIVNATGATSTGALIGTAENVSISDCDVITKNTGDTINYYISGQGNVGGLIGTATGSTADNKISNCSSDAVVRSANGVESNVGGLVGSSDGTDYTGCNSSAKVTGGTFVDITENNNSEFCYLGGLVGLAKNATFNNTTSTASVKGTPRRDAQGNVVDETQDNYIGGLIGKADNCTLEANVSATLSDMPSYAFGAGGLVGYMNKGLIKDAGVTLNISDNSKAVEVEHFGGLACYLSGVKMETTGEEEVKVQINGTLYADQAAGAVVGSITSSDGSTIPELENIHVIVDGSINGIEAAGFAIEAGGKITNCCVIPKNTDSMCVNGSTSSAGFVLTNKADITYSYVLGDVKTSGEGHAAGFALANHASIKQCLANVSVSDKHAFVKNVFENSTIKNCYGWLWDSESTSALNVENNCSYSYFVNGVTDKMVLYIDEGSNRKSTPSTDIINTDALSDEWAVRILNEGTPSGGTAAWENPADGYDYPELVGLSHKGNSKDPTGGNYSFGALYVETYSDGSYGVDMTDISNADAKKAENTLNNEKAISSVKYYAYHRTSDSTSGVGDALAYNAFGDLGLNQLYSIYPVNGDGSVTVKVGNDEISMNTHYGPKNSNDAYRIRTSDHFKNIKHNTGSKFVLEKDVTASETIASFSGSLSCTSGTITTKFPLFGTLSGTLSKLDVKATIEAGENAYGIIANTLNGGTLTDCDILDGSKITGTKAAVFVGDAQSGSFTDCDATVEGGLPFANFKPKGSIDEDAQYISRYDFGDTTTRSITEDPLSMTSLEGKTFDTVTSDITVSNCTLNGTAVSLTTAYYYSISDYNYSMTESYVEFITMKDANPTFDQVVTSDTVYYVHISNDVYEPVEEASIESTEEATTFHYKTSSLGEKTVTITSSGDNVNKSGLKLYTKQVNELGDGTYFIFSSDNAQMLVYNGTAYEWEAYSTNYRTDMVWIYDKSTGAWRNAADSSGTISLDDATGINTVPVTYGGGNTAVTGKLRKVSVYKTVTKEDTANILNANTLP